MSRVSTGIAGLDEILNGGWIPGRGYIVCGSPGAGKTIAGMHFLEAGLRNGESVLFISLDQPEAQIVADGKALGFAIEKAAFLDLTPSADAFIEMQTYDIFSPSEVERDLITKMISEKIDGVNPQRIFVDGFGQFRRLASDAFHFRRLIQSFFRYATQSGATVLASCDATSSGENVDIQSVADGVVSIECSRGLHAFRV